MLRPEMTDVQIGKVVSVHGRHMYRDLPDNIWKSPLKFEESDSWSFADLVIGRAIVKMTYIDEQSCVSLNELIKRVKAETHTEESYLVEAITRMLREPPVNGYVKSYRFKS